MASTASRPDWMVGGDERLLAAFAEQRLDYVALAASRTGLHVPFAERRCRVLAAHGLLERATAETTYRITRRGERFLDGSVEVSTG